MTTANIDTGALEGLKELLGESFVQLIETYLRDSKIRIEKIEKAISDKDLDEVMQQAHGLKGSSRNVGIITIGDISERMEHESRAGEDTQLLQHFSAIEQEFAAVEEVLKTYL